MDALCTFQESLWKNITDELINLGVIFITVLFYMHKNSFLKMNCLGNKSIRRGHPVILFSIPTIVLIHLMPQNVFQNHLLTNSFYRIYVPSQKERSDAVVNLAH